MPVGKILLTVLVNKQYIKERDHVYCHVAHRTAKVKVRQVSDDQAGIVDKKQSSQKRQLTFVAHTPSLWSWRFITLLPSMFCQYLSIIKTFVYSLVG